MSTKIGELASGYLTRCAERNGLDNDLSAACRDMGALRGSNDELIAACEAAAWLISLPDQRLHKDVILGGIRAAIARAKSELT